MKLRTKQRDKMLREIQEDKQVGRGEKVDNKIK